MSNNKTLTIAWREFKQTVFRPIFLLAVLGMPLVFGAIMILFGYMMAKYEEPPLVGVVAVVESTTDLSDALKVEFSAEGVERARQKQVEKSMEDLKNSGGGFSPGANNVPPLKRGEIKIDIVHIDPAEPEFNLDTVQQRVRSGELLAAAVVDDELLQPSDIRNRDDDAPQDDTETETASTDDKNKKAAAPQFLLFASPDLNNDHLALIEDRLGESVVRVRSNRAGLDPVAAMAMLRSPTPTTKRLLVSGEEKSENELTRVFQQMIPMAFMGLMFIGVFVAGQHLLMSTIEEKSTRVMEVLLSAVSPLQLMTGKILGHGAVGLLLVAIYGSVGIAALIAFAAANYIDLTSLAYLVIFFFMGYFMVASMFAAVGGAVSDIREANALITPAMLTVWIPWMLWMPISKDPNGVVGTVFSFVPPISPFVMMLRVSADEAVPTWQIIAGIIWGMVCVLAMIWMAAKIFRVGVLMYGKPPSFIQLLKWLRYS